MLSQKKQKRVGEPAVPEHAGVVDAEPKSERVDIRQGRGPGRE
jgi:hypothetical protein